MRRALVAGALGVSGRAVVNHLAALEDWEVVGLSRRSPEVKSSARYVSVDLLNRSEADAVIRSLGDVSHIFYAALYWGSNIFDEVAPNLAMLQPCRSSGESLRLPSVHPVFPRPPFRPGRLI